MVVEVLCMEYCPMCKRIVEIRKGQERDFFDDLCTECKLIYIMKKEKEEKVRY